MKIYGVQILWLNLHVVKYTHDTSADIPAIIDNEEAARRNDHNNTSKHTITHHIIKFSRNKKCIILKRFEILIYCVRGKVQQVNSLSHRLSAVKLLQFYHKIARALSCEEFVVIMII